MKTSLTIRDRQEGDPDANSWCQHLPASAGTGVRCEKVVEGLGEEPKTLDAVRRTMAITGGLMRPFDEGLLDEIAGRVRRECDEKGRDAACDECVRITSKWVAEQKLGADRIRGFMVTD